MIRPLARRSQVRRPNQEDVTGPPQESAAESAMRVDLAEITPPQRAVPPVAAVIVAAAAGLAFALLTTWIAERGSALPAVDEHIHRWVISHRSQASITIARVCTWGGVTRVVLPALIAVGALLVATASATQDIVVDAFRVESLPENEQAAGMASYVAAYRIGMLVSTAGALFLVSAIQAYGFDKQAAWHWGYVAMGALVLIGTLTALIATEPERSRQAEAAHAHQKRFARVAEAAIGALMLVYALRHGKAIVVVPITSLAPVLTVVLSLLLYRLVPHPVVITGIVFASIAILLMAE